MSGAESTSIALAGRGRLSGDVPSGEVEGPGEEAGRNVVPLPGMPIAGEEIGVRAASALGATGEPAVGEATAAESVSATAAGGSEGARMRIEAIPGGLDGLGAGFAGEAAGPGAPAGRRQRSGGAE